MPNADPVAELKARCDTVEECYEFMLAYAGQGLPTDVGSVTGPELRDLLKRCDDALTGLADVLREIVDSARLEPRDPYRTFIDVLERDAGAAQAAVRLVLCQKAISSQLIDNLNASINLRALLTDLFLIDEILKAGAA